MIIIIEKWFFKEKNVKCIRRYFRQWLYYCSYVNNVPTTELLALSLQVLMASEHFIPSKFVFSADYAPVVKNFPMLAALAEACLWPVVLLLFDDQFVPRLSNLYRRRSASDRAKPPQGKCIRTSQRIYIIIICTPIYIFITIYTTAMQHRVYASTGRIIIIL